jgi:hypothetical protein
LAKLKKFDAPFQIELYGGEPSLHPNLKEILLGLSDIDHCKKIEIITNLSRPLAYWQEVMTPNLNVCASFHPEHYDDEFINKIKAIKEFAYIRATINLSDNKEHWPLTLSTIEKIQELGVEYNLHYLNNTETWTSNYTQEFFDTFKPLENNVYQKQIAELYHYEFSDGTSKELKDLEIYRNGLHRFKGYQCTPMFYAIDFDGNIKNMCTGNHIKPVLFKKIDLHKQEICPQEFCSCEGMFNFYKVQV